MLRAEIKRQVGLLREGIRSISPRRNDYTATATGSNCRKPVNNQKSFVDEATIAVAIAPSTQGKADSDRVAESHLDWPINVAGIA